MITSIPTWPIPIRARKPRRNWRECATSRYSRYAAGAPRHPWAAPSSLSEPSTLLPSQRQEAAHGCRRGPSPAGRAFPRHGTVPHHCHQA
ncbi:hypothetical protein E2C01_030675 [Portunus trituberculatus]|uniref:Uncharacterized protein n=1 Tax=Portunus trituberculatus TaxID=210409 RepID=A0A5B7ERG4_PORTR|nr:hypothetical protein [Portunus trituberculatus]